MNSIPSSSSAPTSPVLATAMPPAGRGAKAAREFEASLIASLLESMEKTFASLPGDGTLPGADNYNYLGIQALAGDMAARGGFGIAAMITQHLPEHEGKGQVFGSGAHPEPLKFPQPLPIERDEATEEPPIGNR
jgi:Rod binding domain-containing protein